MSGGIVQISMQDYKSLLVAVMICATLVNTQIRTDTRTQTDRQLLTGYTNRCSHVRSDDRGIGADGCMER